MPSALLRDKDFRSEFDAWFDASKEEDTPVIKGSIFGNILSLPISLSLLRRPPSREEAPPPEHSLPIDRVVSSSGSLPKSISSRKVSSGSTSSFTLYRGPSVNDELPHQSESLYANDPSRQISLLEALEALDSEDPVRMSNDMNYRFDTSRMALLLSDPGKRNTWFSGQRILDLLNAADPNSPLLLDASAGTSLLTYSDVVEFIGGAGDLRRCNIRLSTQIVIYMPPPGPAGALLLMAICAQAIAMPVDPQSSYDDVMQAMVQVKPSVALAFRGLTPDVFVRAAQDSGVPMEWLHIASGPNSNPGLYRSENDGNALGGDPLRTGPSSVVLLLRTSGSTATPKVVPLTNEALSANAVALSKSLKLRKDDVALNAMPLFHIAGIAASVLATVSAGSSLMCLHGFEPSSFLDTILDQSKKQRPTWFTAVPTMHLALMLYGQQSYGQGLPKHHLRFIRTGAAPLSETDAVALSKFWGVDIVSTYSMTEQMPICSTMSQKKSGKSVGNPLLVSLALVDTSTLRPVRWGESGEICISGRQVMSTYWEGTGDSKPFFFIGDRRFFRTGDLGRLDSDRFLYIIGRLKDLIKVGGEQVSPVEVENVVRKHPRVSIAVVFAVPSPTWGEEVGIALVLTDALTNTDSSESDISDVKSWVMEHLGGRKMPRYWKVLDSEDELPKTGSGKYIRNGLADVLGVKADRFDSVAVQPKGAPRMSHGLSGLRYLLSIGVMFNHIGAVWQGEDERYDLV